MLTTGILWTGITITIIYVFYISYFLIGWIKPTHKQISHTEPPLYISIVIAYRNEEDKLVALLHSIVQQHYPQQHFELILVDDHSSDRSQQITQEFAIKNPFFNIILLALPPKIRGKKAALQLAYKKAKHPIILSTDADCVLPSNWLQISSNTFSNNKIQMILGGVKITGANGFLQYFQSLELLSLIGSGAGALSMGHPIMSNGANIGFRKSLLELIKPDKLQPGIPSGDDLFLLSEAKRIYGDRSIHFIKDTSHFVDTYAESKLSGLLNQRIRWVSKSSKYTDAFLLSTSFVVLFENLMLTILLISSFISLHFWPFWLTLWAVKASIDFIFLYRVSKFVSQKYLLKYFPLMAIIYPFFISYTAIAGQMIPFQWKERRY